MQEKTCLSKGSLPVIYLDQQNTHIYVHEMHMVQWYTYVYFNKPVTWRYNKRLEYESPAQRTTFCCNVEN